MKTRSQSQKPKEKRKRRNKTQMDAHKAPKQFFCGRMFAHSFHFLWLPTSTRTRPFSIPTSSMSSLLWWQHTESFPASRPDTPSKHLPDLWWILRRDVTGCVGRAVIRFRPLATEYFLYTSFFWVGRGLFLLFYPNPPNLFFCKKYTQRVFKKKNFASSVENKNIHHIK